MHAERVKRNFKSTFSIHGRDSFHFRHANITGALQTGLSRIDQRFVMELEMYGGAVLWLPIQLLK